MTSMFAHVTLWVLLAAFAGAITVTARRHRHAYAAAGGPCPATQRHTVRPALTISRVEAARLARNPLLWVGAVVTAGAIADVVPVWTRPSIGLLALNMFPLAIGLFAAIHLSTGRDRHAGMDDLARSVPTGARTRTTAHLLAAAWIAVPASVAVVVATLAALGADRTLEGAEILQGTPSGLWMRWTPGGLELAQPAFVVLIAAALAVAAGRWWPHPAAAFLVPLLLFSPVGWNAHGVPLHLAAGPRWTATADGTGALLGHVTTTTLAWHAVFLSGYLALGVAGALLRHDRRPAALALGAVGLAGMITGFVIKVPSFAWLA